LGVVIHLYQFFAPPTLFLRPIRLIVSSHQPSFRTAAEYTDRHHHNDGYYSSPRRLIGIRVIILFHVEVRLRASSTVATPSIRAATCGWGVKWQAKGC